MENKGLVSIIMPSYNSEKYIKDSIESVLKQTYPFWELIIVDDCSKDNTVQVIESFNDERIRLFVNDQNSGAALSRNKALREAKGTWIAFLDSDDIWLPSKLEEQLCFMINHKFDFTYTDYMVLNNGILEKTIITAPNKMTLKKIKKYCYVATLTVMYNSNSVGLVQVSDLKKNNDYAMWLRALIKVDGYRLDKPLSIYNKRDGSISRVRKSKLIKWHYILFRQEFKYGKIHSFFLTIRNLWHGFFKKLFYRKRISGSLYGS